MRIDHNHIESATISQLSRLYGVSEATIGNWLAGRSSPSVAILQDAANRWGLDEAIALDGFLKRCREHQLRERRRRQLQNFMDAPQEVAS